jgi:tetratricopeptide (TPR) repeat protein
MIAGKTIRIVLLASTLLLWLSQGLATNDDLQKERQAKIKKLNEISKEMQSAGGTDEYNDLKEQYDKVTAEIKDIDQKLQADQEAVQKINKVKKLFNEAVQALKLRQYRQAVQKSDEAIALDNTFYRAYYIKGLAHKSLREYPEATKAYEGCIEQNESYTDARIGLMMVHKDGGQFDKAIAVGKAAIQVDPGSEKAFYTLGTIYLDGKRDYENAALNFRKATQLDPEYAKAFYSLGVALNESSKLNEAQLAFENALAVAKGSDGKELKIDSNWRLAEVLVKLGKCQEASTHAQESLQLKNNGAASFFAGKAAVCLGREQEALGYFKAAAKDPVWKKLGEYEIDLIVNKEKYTG